MIVASLNVLTDIATLFVAPFLYSDGCRFGMERIGQLIGVLHLGSLS